MHREPVSPGFSRGLPVNIALFESLSLSATVPAAQLLAGLSVTEENAEYEDCHTSAATTARQAISAARRPTRAARRSGRRMVRCMALPWVRTEVVPPRG